MHDSRLVANKFLEIAEQQGAALTPMQLLKLVYLAHGWMLGLYNRPLIKDAVEAWRYGPVIPGLYDSIKSFRSNPVQLGFSASVPPENFDERENSIINQVYDIYGDFSGLQLSRITHEEGTPWSKTYHNKCRSAVISNDLTQDYFKQKAAEAGEAS